MIRYDKLHGDWVDLDTWYARRNGSPQDHVGVYVQPDLKPFKSPLEGHKVIDGRRELREQLARNNCRIVERGEFPHKVDRKGVPYAGGFQIENPRVYNHGMNGRGR